MPDIIRQEIGEGVARGLNLGIRHALDCGGDYVLLLENDLEADPVMLAEMVDVAESYPMIGCVGPKVYYSDERKRIWSAGGVLRFRGSVTSERGHGKLDAGQYDEIEDVDYVSGRAVLLKRSALERVGLFDAAYSGGAEAADWCVRAGRLGYRCCYAPGAMLWRLLPRTVDMETPGQAYQSGRDSVIFARRCATTRQWLTFWAAVLITLPLTYLRELGRGNEAAVRARWRGIVDGLRA